VFKDCTATIFRLECCGRSFRIVFHAFSLSACFGVDDKSICISWRRKGREGCCIQQRCHQHRCCYRRPTTNNSGSNLLPCRFSILIPLTFTTLFLPPRPLHPSSSVCPPIPPPLSSTPGCSPCSPVTMCRLPPRTNDDFIMTIISQDVPTTNNISSGSNMVVTPERSVRQ
jgi:hypothetical protein